MFELHICMLYVDLSLCTFRLDVFWKFWWQHETSSLYSAAEFKHSCGGHSVSPFMLLLNIFKENEVFQRVLLVMLTGFLW